MYLVLLLLLLIMYLFIVLFIGRLLAFNDSGFRLRGRRQIPPEVKILDFSGADGVKLRGWFWPGAHNRDGRTAVLVHNWLGRKERYIRHAQLMRSAGYHVFLYDQRSHGESGRGLVTYGPLEGGDFLKALEALRRFPEVNPGKIVALGFSLGVGALLCGAALQQAPFLRAMVLEGAFFYSRAVGLRVLQRHFGKWLGYLIGRLVFTPGVAIWSRGRFRHVQLGEAVKKSRHIPLLVIRGEHDRTVSRMQVERLCRLRHSRLEYWEVHGAAHINALETCPGEYRQRVLDFLNRALS